MKKLTPLFLSLIILFNTQNVSAMERAENSHNHDQVLNSEELLFLFQVVLTVAASVHFSFLFAGSDDVSDGESELPADDREWTLDLSNQQIALNDDIGHGPSASDPFEFNDLIIIPLTNPFEFLPAEILGNILGRSNVFARTQFSASSRQFHRFVRSLYTLPRTSWWTDTLFSNRRWQAVLVNNQLDLRSRRHIFTIDLTQGQRIQCVDCVLPEKSKLKARGIGPGDITITTRPSSAAKPTTGADRPAAGIPLQLNRQENSIYGGSEPIRITIGPRNYEAFQILSATDQSSQLIHMLPLNAPHATLASFSVQKMIVIRGKIYLAHYWKGEISVIDPSQNDETVHTINLPGEVRALLSFGNLLLVAHGDSVSLIDPAQDYQVLRTFSVGLRPERMYLIHNVVFVICVGDLRMLDPSLSVINLEDYRR